ncbi:vascular endothelial growth factor D isoform X2 [Kryptolebias marmoratus]|uniref:vascular endothelial growth factor D isoform X2 n=1 Tax=Kryptolebias marmoratus TaxID=37003 RepID=UPI0018ACE1AB|nr:vascular endothelial growth factor D isoform X2 [Kryptolebias marmoratus]
MNQAASRTFFLLGLVLELSWINSSSGGKRQEGLTVMRRWEKDVRSASNLDELLRLTDFPDWKLWKCRLSRAEAVSSPALVGPHRSTQYAAESYSLEILKAVDEEWQRTQCMPREACVDVAKELGTDPAIFFKPPCVSLHRCGGCCNQEGISCRNTSSVFVNKTVLSLIPVKFVPEPVLIKVANHTECRCMEPAIIRRNAQPHRSSGCSLTDQLSGSDDSRRLCATGWIWDCSSERCIPYTSRAPELSVSSWTPDCEVDVECCDSLPEPEPILQPKPTHRCQLNSSVCARRHQRFEKASCRCRLHK